MSNERVSVDSHLDDSVDEIDVLEPSLKGPSSLKSVDALDGTCRASVTRKLDFDDESRDDTNTIHIDVPLRHCYAKENEVVEFQCRVSETPKNKDCEQISTYYWYKNGELIHESGCVWLTVKNQWYKLKMQSVTWSDYGVYTFVYENTTNCVISQAMLFVLDKPSPARALYTSSPRSGLQVVKHLCNLNTKVGESIVLIAKFEVDYRFGIKFTWMKNNQPIAPATVRANECGVSELCIDCSETSDSGFYLVIAETIDSFASSMCEVLVMEKQLSNLAKKFQQGFIEPLPEEVETYVSEEVRLTCQISDADYTHIGWYKDNIVLDESRMIMFEQHGGRTELTLKCPQIKDMGKYTVVIQNRNTGREWKSSCFLDVTQSSFLQELPRVTVDTHLTRTYATIGSSLFLYCKFRIPNCKYLYVVWYIGFYKIERSNQQFKVISHDGDNLLYIKQVEPDMLGEIRCQLWYMPANQRSVPVACTRGTLYHLHPTILREIYSDQNHCAITEVEKIYNSIDKSSSVATWSTRNASRSPTKKEMKRLFQSEVNNGAESLAEDFNQCDDFRCHSIMCEDSILNTNLREEADAESTGLKSWQINEAIHYHIPPATKTVRPAESKANINACTLSFETESEQTFLQEILMDVNYCKIDEFGNIQYLSMERVNSKGTVLSVHTLEKLRGKHPSQTVIQWEHDYPTPEEMWYSIEMPLSNGNFAEIGLSSQPKFEITGPIPDKIMKFRVRMVRALDNVMDAITVSVMPSPETKEISSPEYIPISAMEYFNQKYSKLDGVLGCGAFGSVSLVRDPGGDLFAAKIIKTRTQKKRDQALREYKIMLRLRHPRLVQLYDAFCSRDQFIMVMDYLWGGELFERIVEEDNFKEATAVTYVKQICEGLDYLHKQNIAHLDLKPENVVCLSPNCRDIKIVDFGLSRVLNGEVVRAIYGTRDYIAPEVLSFEPLTTFCDMWSLGVVTYVMLSGMIPFAGETWITRSANITKACYNYDEPALLTVSSRAREFIDRLLVRSPGARLSAAAALRHRWLVYGPPADLELGQLKRWRSNLRTYLATNKARWQRAGNVVIAANRLRARGLPPSPQTPL